MTNRQVLALTALYVLAIALAIWILALAGAPSG